MLTLSKKELKEDKYFNMLLETIKEVHIVADHTMNTLIPMVGIDNYCETATHFIIISFKNDPMYLSYEVTTWVKESEGNLIFPISIDNVTVYDNEMEYELAKTPLKKN